MSQEEEPQLRELEQAPTHLRMAALIVIVGALIPFMGAGGGWMSFAAAKALGLLAAFLWFKQVEHDWGPPLGGLLGKLADIAFVKVDEEKERKKAERAARSGQVAPATLKHPFPTALHLVSLVLAAAAAVALPLMDKTEGVQVGASIAEVVILMWAGYTWVHIHSYERWGKFSPLFPMMFLGMMLAGCARVFFGVGEESPQKLMSLGGGAIVAAGGVLAAYTLFEAMKQAKREGDIKKQQVAEARRAARASRRAEQS